MSIVTSQEFQLQRIVFQDCFGGNFLKRGKSMKVEVETIQNGTVDNC